MKQAAIKFISTMVLSSFFLISGCGGAKPGEGVDSANAAASPPFTMMNLKGENVSLADTLKNNKAVLLNFWATWCPPCRAEIPDLIRLQEQYKNSGVTILGVDVGEPAGEVSSFAQKAGINYPVLLDQDMKVAQSYKVVGIPTTYLMDPDGTILGKYHAVTPELKKDLERALNGS